MCLLHSVASFFRASRTFWFRKMKLSIERSKSSKYCVSSLRDKHFSYQNELFIKRATKNSHHWQLAIERETNIIQDGFFPKKVHRAMHFALNVNFAVNTTAKLSSVRRNPNPTHHSSAWLVFAVQLKLFDKFSLTRLHLSQAIDAKKDRVRDNFSSTRFLNEVCATYSSAQSFCQRRR